MLCLKRSGGMSGGDVGGVGNGPSGEVPSPAVFPYPASFTGFGEDGGGAWSRGYVCDFTLLGAWRVLASGRAVIVGPPYSHLLACGSLRNGR